MVGAAWASELSRLELNFWRPTMSQHCFKFPETFRRKLKTSLHVWLFPEPFAKLGIDSQWTRHFWLVCFHKQEILSWLRHVLAWADHLNKTAFSQNKKVFSAQQFSYTGTTAAIQRRHLDFFVWGFFALHFSSPKKWENKVLFKFIIFFLHSSLYVLSPEVCVRLSRSNELLLWTTLKNMCPLPLTSYVCV